jgi:hypothetical protein
MCTVYSFSGFSRVLIKNGIRFSIRDFLDPEKVDKLIEQLIEKTCDKYSYTGAGISRACFLPDFGDCAIKVNKDFYTDYSDENAREEYSSLFWNKKEYVYGGWQINRLDEVVSSKEPCCDQNADEIRNYLRFLENKDNRLNYVPKLYAVSSNWQVEIFEYCDYYTGDEELDTEQEKRFEEINNCFYDAHDDNLGYNRQGNLVILDFGI